MAKEHWYFLAGVCAVLVPLAFVVAVKRFELLEIRPDRKIVYKVVEGGNLKLHVFAAKGTGADEPAPAILLFHGGRWQYGSPRGFYSQCRFFASRGFTCFSAQYRLGKGGRVDVRAAVADARSALEYVIENAVSLGIDPGKVAAGGGSSGGHLAAMLGVGSASAARPAALILYNPMLDLSPCQPDHHLVRDYWQEVSPFHQVEANVPPTLVLLGSDDPELPVDSARAFCDAVEVAGGHCELAVYEGQTHGFFNYRPGDSEYFDKTNERIMDFLDDVWR